jgi:hypothetical protein
MGLFGSLENSIFEFVSDFDLPANAHRCRKARRVALVMQVISDPHAVSGMAGGY